MIVRIEHTGVKLHGATENLSIGGMLVLTEKTLPVSTSVKVELLPPTKDLLPVNAEGVVVRTKDDKPRGLAIRFTELTTREHNNLVTLIAKLDQTGNAGTVEI